MSYPFQEVRALFDEKEWDVGVLDRDEVMACANGAMKDPSQPYGLRYFNGLGGPGAEGAAKAEHYRLWRQITSGLVLVRRSLVSLDYSLYLEADEILQRHIPHPAGGTASYRQLPTDILKLGHLKYLREEAPWFPIYFDFKRAAIMAGLGVRAKNTMVYSRRFGFDCKICALGFKEEITGYQKRADWGILEMCEGCTDCMDNCPAGAIHCDGRVKWLDAPACDDFLLTGDPARGISGVIDVYHDHLEPNATRQEAMQNVRAEGMNWNRDGFHYNRAVGLMKDGEVFPIPICRVCQEQPRCSNRGKDKQE